MTGALVDRTIAEVGDYVQRLLRTDGWADRDGFLQSVTPAVKIAGLFVLIVVTVSLESVPALLSVLGLTVTLTLLSRVPLGTLARRILPTAAASFVVVAPQLLLLPGESVLGPVTDAGVAQVSTFVCRVAASLSLLSLLLLTTRFSDVLAGLGRLGVPRLGLTYLAVTHRYLLVFFDELTRVVRARRSRTIVSRGTGQTWRETGTMLGGFLLRALERGERVQRNVRSKGGATVRPARTRGSLGVADAAFGTLVAVVVGLRVWVVIA